MVSEKQSEDPFCRFSPNGGEASVMADKKLIFEAYEALFPDIRMHGQKDGRINTLDFKAESFPCYRAKIPNGWIVKIGVHYTVSSFFVPDPNHTWDGGSLP